MKHTHLPNNLVRLHLDYVSHVKVKPRSPIPCRHPTLRTFSTHPSITQTLSATEKAPWVAELIIGVPESAEEFPLMATVQAQRQQIAVSTQNSHLLDLPGELRNKIYSYCIEPVPVPLRLRHEDNIEPVGKFRCFTQTCRQIRHEFQLIYMDQTTFRLASTYHYARYIRDFYPPADDDSMMRYRGSIISLIHHSRDIIRGVKEFYDADIARVVQLVARSPHVQFSFELHEHLRSSGAQIAVTQVNSMLAIFANPPDSKWRDMTKAIREIRLRVQNHDSKLRILMSEEMARKWKSTVFRIWDDATEPTRGIREIRLAYADPNPDRRPYTHHHQFSFDDSWDKTISWSWSIP